MINKLCLTIAAVALALTPSVANAFTGVLVSCTGDTHSTNATLAPGLTCTNVKNTIKVKSSKGGFFSCTTTAAPATVPNANWDLWKTKGGFGSKLTSADATSIAKADVDISGITFGSCNFAGDGTSGNSSKPFGTGTVQFYNSGMIKPANAASKFTARISGDLATTSAQTIGIVTSGPGSGGTIIAQVPLDIGALLTGDPNTRLYQCNVSPGAATYCASNPFGHKDNGKCTAAGIPTAKCSGNQLGGYGCKQGPNSLPSPLPPAPYPCCTAKDQGDCVPPVAAVPLVTNGGFITISYDSNSDCTADGTPYTCCTGSGTGKCN